MKKIFSVFVASLYLFGADYYYMNGDKRVDLTPMPQKETALRGLKNIMTFKNPAGQEIAIPDKIIVKFKTLDNTGDYLNLYDLKVLKKLRGGVYLLGAKSPKAAIEAANALNDAPDIMYAQPDIIKKRHLR
ncbi:S8 family serine peptidase [Hydrogenimonas sp.]